MCCITCLYFRHYPKTSFTAVTETPEMARLAQQTKLQSQVPNCMAHAHMYIHINIHTCSTYTSNARPMFNLVWSHN